MATPVAPTTTTATPPSPPPAAAAAAADVAFKQLNHTTIHTEQCVRSGFAVSDDSLFVGKQTEVMQFSKGEAAHRACNYLEPNVKLDVLDVTVGEAGSEGQEVFVLTTYNHTQRKQRELPRDVFPLFVSLFKVSEADKAVELFCQPLPVHGGGTAALAYSAGHFLVAQGSASGSRVFVYRRIANGIKDLFQEVHRLWLPALPDVLGVALRGGMALLYNDVAIATWAWTAAPVGGGGGGGAAACESVLPTVTVAGLATATLTSRGHVVTGSSTGRVQVFDAATLAEVHAFDINCTQANSMNPTRKRASVAKNNNAGEELVAALAAAKEAASASSDNDSDENTTVFAIEENSESGSESGSETETDADSDVDLEDDGGSPASVSSATADEAAAVGGADVFKDIINIGFSVNTLFVHTFSDDLLLYGYA